MREAAGYMAVVGVFLLLLLRIFHAPPPPTLHSHGNLSSPSTQIPSLERSLPQWGLTLIEVNRSTPLYHKIVRVWGEAYEGEKQSVTGEQEGGVSKKSESHGLQKRGDGNRSESRSRRAGEINGSKAPTASPRYGVAFWLQNPHAGEEEENSSGYGDLEGDVNRLLERIGATLGDPVYLRIFKEERELEVWMEVAGRYEFLQRYQLCTLEGELGPKLDGDDGQFPEGFYQISKIERMEEPLPYRELEISYPNGYDRFYDRTGGPVRIYGSCEVEEGIGISPENMEVLYTLVQAALVGGESGVAVHSFPFRMSDEAMRTHLGEVWYLFWENLQQGYSLFNRTYHLPQVFVNEGEYIFRLTL